MTKTSRDRSFRWIVAVFLVPILGVVFWWIAGQITTDQHLRAARKALENDDAGLAGQHLSYCLRVWPQSGEVNFLAARAARLKGELADAIRYLEVAAKNGWVPEAIDLERALWRAQRGDIREVEQYLQYCLVKEHPDSVLITEILTPIYLAEFNLHLADECVQRWLKLRPESAAAWNSKAILCEKQRQQPEAVEAYQEVVRLAPNHTKARLALVRLLLDLNKPQQAVNHINELKYTNEFNEDVLLVSARAAIALNNRKQAYDDLATLLSKNPQHAEGLHLRGKLRLEEGNAKEARPDLERAVSLAPFEKEILYTWLRCLRQTGTPQEIKDCQVRLERLQADLDRVKELAKQIRDKPQDADLRYQMGAIYLRNRQEREGVRWLQSALRVKADHQLSHRLLTEYYDRKGETTLAQKHRILAEGKNAPNNRLP